MVASLKCYLESTEMFVFPFLKASECVYTALHAFIPHCMLWLISVAPLLFYPDATEAFFVIRTHTSSPDSRAAKVTLIPLRTQQRAVLIPKNLVC